MRRDTARKLRVVDVAEPRHAGPVEARLRSPASSSDDREAELTVEQLVRIEQHPQVLARLERGDGEHVRPLELGAFPVRREYGCRRGMRDVDPLRGNVQQVPDVARGEVRVAHDDVRRPRGVAILGAVHPHGAPMRPLRKTERDEVVDGRRPDPVSLRGVHPVREVEDVEAAQPALGGRPLQARPCGPPRVGEREPWQP
jgi:hypothetical protein